MTPKNTPSKSHQEGRRKVGYVEVVLIERMHVPINHTNMVFYGKGLTKAILEKAIRQKFTGFMFAEYSKGRKVERDTSITSVDHEPARSGCAEPAHSHNPVKRYGGRHE